jgi:GrpB-like predicted nucleotidyltransferase (UPF0157 family)
MPLGSYYIATYDPAWPLHCAVERAAIVARLGLDPARLEHVGSTAVPGLGAKPIMDLMLGVGFHPSLASAAQVLAALEPLGYHCKGTETVPGTLYCPKVQPLRFNLHLTEYQNDFWDDHLLFRDHLRRHPDAARDYEALKRGILAKMGDEPDRLAYSNQKDGFILAAVAQARAEQRRGGHA